jgi:hypothetical protein
MVLYGMINGVNIHWIIIGIRIGIITGIYPPVSSNLASWEIPELNGSFNGKTIYKWDFPLPCLITRYFVGFVYPSRSNDCIY